MSQSERQEEHPKRWVVLNRVWRRRRSRCETPPVAGRQGRLSCFGYGSLALGASLSTLLFPALLVYQPRPSFRQALGTRSLQRLETSNLAMLFRPKSLSTGISTCTLIWGWSLGCQPSEFHRNKSITSVRTQPLWQSKCQRESEAGMIPTEMGVTRGRGAVPTMVSTVKPGQAASKIERDCD